MFYKHKVTEDTFKKLNFDKLAGNVNLNSKIGKVYSYCHPRCHSWTRGNQLRGQSYTAQQLGLTIPDQC